ncbi:response regulator transcription factor [Pararobbsia alpina]|uniref:response regulator transcription factor n=1 Tax=Pararobbsia alpina TaxID=621374 RepID=UPI0039A421C7
MKKVLAFRPPQAVGYAIPSKTKSSGIATYRSAWHVAPALRRARPLQPWLQSPATHDIMRFHLPLSSSGRCLQWHEPASVAHVPVRVLVVDDHHDTAEVLATVFGLEHYDTTIANNGRSALKSADAFQPDVILLDITLPDISGVEVARTLRSQGYKGAIIAVTALGYDKDVIQYEQAGFDGFCQKPVDIEELIQLVHDLSHRRPSDSGPH